ncbi:Hypothetical predicted protein [Cloeon dipterum]|uniref:SprT-like domain-containing protein n=1 Tax=Cloeon dipterum TaxID=197152 RepID=A0A8S1E164_9INSE|nr:Hypothetical predicted protein [Cloeon dipterum]
MEKKNLDAIANLFTPPISRRRPKKKKKDGIDAVVDAGRLLSLGMSNPRDIKNPLLTSDESEGEEAAVIQNLNAWLTDDESETQPTKPKSTTTSKTSNTYVTCLTSQCVPENLIHYELSEEEDDGVAVISKGVMDADITEDEDEVSVVQQQVVVTTPDAEVSSCEKVQVWLQRLNTSGHAVRHLLMEPPALEQPISQGTSTGYPLTERSQNRDSSFCATSRLNSSSDSLPTTVPAFNSQASSRSSSFYFRDRVPWSKSQPPPPKQEKKPTSVKKLSNRSGLTIWSDARSTQESFHLRIETSEENQENSFSSVIPIQRASEASTRQSTTSGSASDSLPETVAKLSDVYASSEQCKPLVDLTNHSTFNPVLSSTMRDSVFSFPSGDLEYKKSLDRTLEKTPIVRKQSKEKRPSMLERREVILISSDDDCNGESSDCISASSEDEREKRTIITKTPLKTRLVDVMTSDSDSEEEPVKVLSQVVPETDDESEKSTQFDEEGAHCSKASPQQKAKSPMARARAISESEDDEELVEQFFKKQKQKKNEEMTPRKDPEEYEIGDDSFIVEDDVIYVDSDVSDDEVEQQKNFSPSFYLRVLNDQRKANASSDVTIKEANWSEARKLFTQVKTPKGKNKNDMKTPKRCNDGFHRPTLGFLASLSTEEPSVLCHPDAVPFLKNFKSRKDDLVEKLFALFNRTVFDDKLDPEMSITWNNRLRSTAGFCYNQRKRVEGGDTIRFSRIELSGKILQNAGQLRDTLIHEMCHAATWVIDEMLGGHGPVWKKWTRKANRIHPELPEIKRCHSYQIETAYTYRCTKCQYSFGRSSKSLDTERKVCGYCKGKFELIVNNKKGTPREPKGFALFVKENYKIVKQKDMKHKDVMQLLSEKFKSTKL